MRLFDIISEAGDDSGDYQQMQAFVRANRVGGVPDSQQIPLALFKELKRQQAQNQALGRELSDAERRIDQATRSGELSQQELGLHRGELERERKAGERQKGAVAALGQQYSEREQASQEQMADLTAQLAQVKSQPGIDSKSAAELERQIKELGDRSVPVDRLADLESSIQSIQQMQTVDDSAIKELIDKVKDAEQATKEITQTRQKASQDVEQAATRAMSQVEQMRQDLDRLNGVANQITTAVSDALPARIDSLAAKMQELDSESEHQYDELLKHDNMLNQITGNKGTGGLPMEPPPGPKPNPAPNAPDSDQTAQMARDAITRARLGSQLAQAHGHSVVPNPQRELDLEPVAEDQFQRRVAWAIGKTK